MPVFRHRQQRRAHLIRYGPWHLVRHLRNEQHGHFATVVVSSEARRRNLLMYAAVAAGAVVIALIVLVIFSIHPLSSARADLNSARTLIGNDLHNKALLTTATGRANLLADIGEVSEDAALANQTLSSSASIRILATLPVLDTQRDGLLTLSTDVEKAAAAATSMLQSLDNLVSTSHGTTVSLPALAQLEFLVVAGQIDFRALNRSASGLIGPIGAARAAFDAEDTKLVRLLSLSAKTLSFARPFLGSSGPQAYLVGAMNDAEMRDSGAVLSLDLLTTTDGTFSISHATTYGDYLLSTPATVALPAGTEKIFGAYLPTENWPAVDATADFALTGESMQAMWHQATGQEVNGVIGIDVPAVASILKLTGPVLVPGIPEPVTASNVADLLLNKAYAGDTVNDPQNARRDKISAVVKAAIDQMKTEHVDLDSFANALAADVQGRHLMVWSDTPATETGLATLDAAGTLTTAQPNRTFHVAVENSTADKLDYFVRVGLTMHVTVDPSGSALVNTSVTVANTALPGQPPSYQYGPDGVNAFTPGQYVARVFFWGPAGSTLPGSTPESGLELTQSHFSLLPGGHDSVTFATVIPHAVVNGHLDLRLVPQARLVPDQLTVQLSAPGWDVRGRTHLTRALANTTELTWGLTH